MAYSKTFLLLGLVFAVVLLVSYEVSARELAQETVQTDAEDKRHCPPGKPCCHGEPCCHGKPCCPPGDHHGKPCCRCCPCCPPGDHHGKPCCPCHGAAGKKLEESDLHGKP